jgi:hypothetical protein
MKIRIKGNSIRFRLTRSEVEYFKTEGFIQEKTDFGSSVLICILKETIYGDHITVDFSNNALAMNIPAPVADEWTSTDKVSCESEIEIGVGKKLFLLLEKDFKCLDNAGEDQSDNYENPLALKAIK